MKKQLFLFAVPVMVVVSCAESKTVGLVDIPSESYHWSSVPIVGGGFVDGIIMHPFVDGVRYLRTDMGGAYRWNSRSDCWEPLLDWVSLSESNLQGVESIAIDPSDPHNVYIACGTYVGQKPTAVLYSRDGGYRFSRVDVPFSMGGNMDGRGNGERLMVNPSNSDEIFMGTRNEGLWRSVDKGLSWHQVTSFPVPVSSTDFRNQGSGVITEVFDGGDIYVAVSCPGTPAVYRSRDAGSTWQPLENQPSGYLPTHMVLSGDRKLYISYGDRPGPSQMGDGALWCYDIASSIWTDISPVKIESGIKSGFGYAAIAVDARNPSHLIASTHSLSGKHGYTQDELFRSIDGGSNWKGVFSGKYKYDSSLSRYVDVAPLHWMFDVEIDPFDSDHAIFTTGFGGWETFNLSHLEKNDTVVWQLMAKGVEETVPLELCSPPSGPRLLSGIGDYGGFTHFDITKTDPLGSHSNPHFGNTNGISCAWEKPEIVVRVGTLFGSQPGAKTISYSEDGGITWSPCESLPFDQARNGHIAVSSDGASWIWTPERADAYLTTDKGSGLIPCSGLPVGIRVVADKVNPTLFYAVDAVNEVLYSSLDGGRTFTADSLHLTVQNRFAGRMLSIRQSRGDSRGGQDRVYSAPDRERDLWIAAYDGLYHSERYGAFPFRRLDKVSTIYAFGFGKGRTAKDYPSLYLIGVVNGVYGFFRSDDCARTWIRINDDLHQYGLVLHITGDMQEYGRVYVGTHGRGIITGVSMAD